MTLEEGVLALRSAGLHADVREGGIRGYRASDASGPITIYLDGFGITACEGGWFFETFFSKVPHAERERQFTSIAEAVGAAIRAYSV